MIFFRVLLYAGLVILIVVGTVNYFAFRKNLVLVAKHLGFSKQDSLKGIVYEGYFDGRKVEIGREDRWLGLFTTSNSRVILKSSVKLSAQVDLKLTPRRFFENVLLVEGENVLAEQLFEIEGEPKDLFVSCFEERPDFRIKTINCVQNIGSGGQQFLEIKSNEISLEHGRFRLRPQEIVPLFEVLSLIATSLESQGIQTMEALHE